MNPFNFKKSHFDSKVVLKYFFNFWENNFRIVFAISSLVILSAGVYLWYQSIFKSDWNSDKKNQYKNSQSREVELKENQFKNVIGEIDRKKNIYDGKNESIKDIFAPYPEDAVRNLDANSSGASVKNTTLAPSSQTSPTF